MSPDSKHGPRQALDGKAYPGHAQHEVAYGEPGYPESLLALPNPPKRLYMIGDVRALDRPAMAIVGARKASPYGLLCANRFARRAAFLGLVVVSGGAVGCDQAAHQGALEMESRTIVVLGCGADVVYPNKARTLFEQVLDGGGLIISELPWGSSPASWAFIKRNRLIAGLASATLIVEAGLPSGTFSTADAALSAGAELLVVPGSILSKQSAGSNRLIAQGAWPIIDDPSFDAAVAEIYQTLPGVLRTAARHAKHGSLPFASDDQQLLAMADDLADDGLPETAKDKSAGVAGTTPSAQGETPGCLPSEARQSQDPHVALLERLRTMPAMPDELVGVCGANVVEVVRYLSSLEFAGQVTRQLDGRFALSMEGYGVGHGSETDYDRRSRPGGQ